MISTVHFFDVYIKNKTVSQSDIINIKEKHSMRYLFFPELIKLLNQTGFELIHFFEWKTFNTPNINSWNAVIACKAI